MAQIDLDQLEKHVFFRDFPPTLVEFLLPLAEEQAFPEGKQIINRDGDAEEFFLIKNGLVTIQLNDPEEGEVDIETLSEGDPLGWSWVHPPYVWQFSARAENETNCYVFPAEELRERCQMEPELGYRIYRQLLKTVSDRLSATRLQLLKQKDIELPPGLDDVEL